MPGRQGEALTSFSPLPTSSDFYKVSPGGARGPQRTVVLLASPASPQGTDGEAREGGQLGSHPTAPTNSQTIVIHSLEQCAFSAK